MRGTPTTEVRWLDESFTNDPYALYAELRKSGPAHQVVLPSGLKVWLITGYEEARAALADPSVSKDGRAFQAVFDKHVTNPAERGEFADVLSAHMLNSDPPDHTRLRKLVTKAFTARRIEQLRPRIEEITAELLDQMAGKDEVELLDAFAFPLPITVICELLAVPMDDRDAFRDWSNTIISGRGDDAMRDASMAMAGYLTQLIAHKRANPGDDMFSALIQASDEDDRLNEAELISMAFLLLVAGHETTVNLIGNGVLALLRHPDQLAALRADFGLLPNAIEEFLRYEGPVNTATLRFTTQPLRLGEVVIPAEEIVLVALASANRDPGRFADPDKLDITRPTSGHVAFGHGIHYCLGAPLARLEGEIAIRRLLERFPNLRLAADPVELSWRGSTIVHGLRTLPVGLA
ncbi:cytochrome P450 family protein [Goodfellowiella coeruleoviolacea]|uniref:Cytochrome P450 n=1 Tax=Goodfellowiella coeruleoviolacea TaxID=334858 RepID=A0AAE3GKX3_9PSEU|nr:cytochrome P450 [Goodfellowiella coeruleoviolacea]MCP2169518.1 Cytochrome P450 [Goodfellowiella coeruleoviolacea]